MLMDVLAYYSIITTVMSFIEQAPAVQPKEGKEPSLEARSPNWSGSQPTADFLVKNNSSSASLS
jgi:hypothetical protein